jgi:hypothetical protein
MIDFTKKEVDFINELISKHWVYNNTCHKENKEDFELSLNIVKKLSLYGVVNSMPTFKDINELEVGETIFETENYKVLKR